MALDLVKLAYAPGDTVSDEDTHVRTVMITDFIALLSGMVRNILITKT